GLERFVDFSEVGPQRVGKEMDSQPLSIEQSLHRLRSKWKSYGHVHSSQYDFKEEALIVDNRVGAHAMKDLIG
ncbi:Hypothetical protein FKW44_021407, partial [Caligus rogercresseyi]